MDDRLTEIAEMVARIASENSRLLQRLAEPGSLANESTKEERIYRLNLSVLANRALSEAPSSAGVSAILSSIQAGQISATA